jgi:hypothetical protein
MGAYLVHPSIKVKAKAGKQVHDSFSLKLVTLTYLIRPALRLDTPSFTSHPMADQATKRPMEESLEVVPTHPRFCAMLRWDREGSSAAPPPESQSRLLAISDDNNGGWMMSSCWWSS